MDNLSLLTITLTLFLIMDPIGNISSFLSLTENIKPLRQKYVVLRELCIALLVMLLFNFIGETLLRYLELSHIAVRLSAGVILFLVAIKFLFPAEDSLRSHLPSGEPFLIPLAIPLIAGPSLLATIMLYANLETCKPLMLAGILFAWMASVVILLLAPQINRLLGKNGLVACERLMAMLLVMLAIQRLMEGLTQFINQSP
jgi:multiple antibiotic resistance protein